MADTPRQSLGKTVPDSPSVSTALLDTQAPASPGFTPPMAPFARTSRAPSVQSFYSESPYGGPGNRVSSIVDKWSLGPDPRQWGADLSYNIIEDDDELHKPEKNMDTLDRGGGILSARGIANLGCVLILVLGLVALFAGYPIIHFVTSKKDQDTFGAFGVGGTNSTGQVPVIPGGHRLIDPETPLDVYTKPSWFGREEMELVFSDEFNTDGRTFYAGDDPFWEAVDLHYHVTSNEEWYDPRAVTTGGGALAITFTQGENHELGFTGGMIQSWNKFCFTGGLLEASVMMPNRADLFGMWPAVWTMGNLGRAGYAATTDGLWPYSYDACDVGTLPGQNLNGVPAEAMSGNNDDKTAKGAVSLLPGQRLSACTCPADAAMHPGPRRKDGTFAGRSAPEIDVFEQQGGSFKKPPYKGDLPEISQSAQFAPFNIKYKWEDLAVPGSFGIDNGAHTIPNGYLGGPFQQAASYITLIDPNCFELNGQCFSVYGFEYKPGFDDGYIQWISDNKKAWHVTSQSFPADPIAQISARPIPNEPLYILVNLGMSKGFIPEPNPNLKYPSTMYVDWIRVYQPKGKQNVGCSPKDMPTAEYINKYSEAYTNPNYTIWTTAENKYNTGFNQTFPRNKLKDQC